MTAIKLLKAAIEKQACDAEADAIERLMAGNVPKRLKTYDAARLAAFKADGMRYAINLRLLTFSQGYSQNQQ